MEAKINGRHLEFGLYEESGKRITKSASEWFDSIIQVQSDYLDGSYHIPSYSEWDMLSNYHKTELQVFLNNQNINVESNFISSSWNAVKEEPYYRKYLSDGSMGDHTGNMNDCYCLLIKWSK